MTLRAARPCLLLPMLAACWRPGRVDLPPTRVHTADEIAGDIAEARAAEADDEVAEPVLNTDPDGLDPYWVVTVVAPVTLVDDAGTTVGVLNTPGATMVVKKEDGDVRRLVACTMCSPPVDGWVRMADIQLTKPPGGAP